MRNPTFIFVVLLASIIPTITMAHNNEYPVSSRAIFLSGCLLENKELNFNDDQEIYNSIRICTCLLDQFQLAYSNAEFVELFTQATNNKEPESQELDKFTKKHIMSCL